MGHLEGPSPLHDRARGSPAESHSEPVGSVDSLGTSVLAARHLEPVRNCSAYARLAGAFLPLPATRCHSRGPVRELWLSPRIPAEATLWVARE